MKRHFLIGVMAALLAFPAVLPAAAETADPLVQAQQTEADRATLVEARIAALKAGLKLTPEQQKNWDGLEGALREVVGARAARRKAFLEQAGALREKDEVIEAMNLVAKNFIARGEELKKVAAAAAPLFASLDAAQKHRFAVLLRSFAAQSGQN
jgi:hypothetical protein